MEMVQNLIRNLSAAEKLQFYSYHTKPVLNFQALFTDGSSNYMNPVEPKTGDEVTVRFRTARENAEHVFLCVNGEKKEMQIASKTERFDFYESSFFMGTEIADYYFEIHSGGTCCYFNKKGPARDLEPFFNYKVTPGFSTPDWAKGAIFYQIYVDRFANGDTSNDVLNREYIYINQPSKKIDDWYRYPEEMDVRNFYGGDLQGVLDHLDYLKGLGVDVIYLNPIFVSPSNHKYDIQDYDYIDPHYGKIVVDEGNTLPDWENNNMNASKYISRVTDKRNLEASNEFFIHFVEEVHKKGMRVILDGVFNHCGSFNKWMDAERIYENQYGYEKGAFVDANSPYRHFFKFYNQNAWPYNDDYDGWWGHKTLPKLNYEESRQLYDYILNVGRKWVSPPYNADGWRLDVAADLGCSNEYNHMFWKRFRKEVKEANPEALILAEHYGDPGEWLQGDEWDSVMNYDAFMEPLTWFLTGMEKHSDERRTDLWGNADNFIGGMRHFMASMLTPSLQVAMNELSNHDHSRFLTRTNHIVGRAEHVGAKAAEEGVNYAVMREAVTVQMTWVGAPTVYYGDEAGVCGFTDPDNRRTYPWGRENKELLAFHKEMIRIHKQEKPLRKGSIKLLYAERNVLAYARFQEDEQIIVILNNSKDLKELTVPVWFAGVPKQGRMERFMYTYEEGYTTEYDEFIVENGEIVINMGRHSAIVMKPISEGEKTWQGK